MESKYNAIPEFPNYAINNNLEVIDKKTQTRLTEYPMSGYSYVIVDGFKVPIPLLYVWTFVGKGNFRIVTDKIGYTYAPPTNVIQISDDEYFLGASDARAEEMEYFKRIPGFSQYLISPTGLVYNKERYKFLRRTYDHAGYFVTTLVDDNGFRAPRKVHRLTYVTFVGPISDNMTIDHIDRLKWNNDPRNLRALYRADNKLKAPINDGKYTDVAWTPFQVNRVCKCISEGKSMEEIGRSINYDTSRYNWDSLKDLVLNIRTGDIYQDVMLQYVKSLEDIPNHQENGEPTKFTKTPEIYSKPPEAQTEFNYREKQYRLTPKDAVDIKSRIRNGESFQAIADAYKVSPTIIYNIDKGKAWKTIQ